MRDPIYAVGDLHGSLDILNKAYEEIRRDSAQLGIQKPRIVFLGDYIDRGPNSREVVDTILENDASCWQKTLRGNHDAWFNDFLREGVTPGNNAGSWLANNPAPTFASYGCPLSKEYIRSQSAVARAVLIGNVPKAHRDFFRTLPLYYREGNCLFVHAGIDPNRSWDDQRRDEHTLTWNRDSKRNSLMGEIDPRETHGFTVIHGHTIFPIPKEEPGQLGIDTGGYGLGHLAVARVQTAKAKYDLLPVVTERFFTQIASIGTCLQRGEVVPPKERSFFSFKSVDPEKQRDFDFQPYLKKLFRRGLADPTLQAAAEDAQSFLLSIRKPSGVTFAAPCRGNLAPRPLAEELATARTALSTESPAMGIA